ncbi:HTH-type quorum sensing-dependent transcriptional regulator RpaR [Sulfitobacter sp. DSM 110093]|nr:HTH-type quorum sensing-dependent transcriptional regulator RpaR [Sulfitobacter sp. DSM 110093]
MVVSGLQVGTGTSDTMEADVDVSDTLRHFMGEAFTRRFDKGGGGSVIRTTALGHGSGREMIDLSQHNPKTLDELVHGCHEAKTAATLLACGLAYYQLHGIDLVSYHGDSAGAPAILYRFAPTGAEEPQWHSQFLDIERLRDSPLGAMVRNQVLPVYWYDVVREARLTRSETLYMEGLLRRHPNGGVSLKVHGPGGDSAVVGLGFAAKQARLSPSALYKLLCAAQIAHLRYCVLAESQSPRNFGLSPREVEVLEWIATGKSNGVIAEILGISPHTVDTIVRRIFSKLDVNDRTTAAIRGLGAGLLRRPKDAAP